MPQNRKYIQFFVDAGTLLDLPESGFSLQMTFSIRNKKNPFKTKGSQTERSFTMPATKQNDAVFGSWWDFSKVDPLANALRPARIEVNGLEVLRGKVQLQEAGTLGRFYKIGGKDYKLRFLVDNSDWIQLLRGVRLSDLNWEDEEHTFDSATVGAQLSATASSVLPVGYGPVKFKDWATTLNVMGAFVKVIQYQELTPVVFIKNVVEKCFDFIGYTVDSNFFDLENGLRYCMPIQLDQRIYPKEFSIDFTDIKAERTVQTIISDTFSSPLVFNVQTQTPSRANPWSGTTWTAAHQGFVKVEIQANFVNADGLYVFGYFVLKNGLITNLVIGLENPITADSNQKGVAVIPVVPGDTIEVFEGVDLITATTVDRDVKISIEQEVQIVFNTFIDFRYLVQDFDCVDFLRGVFETFNMIPYADLAANNIVIEPSDQYLYQQRTPVQASSLETGFYINTANDITPKVDLSRDGRAIFAKDFNREVLFEYKENGDDDTLKTLNTEQEIKVNASKYTLPDSFKSGRLNIKNSFFVPTLHLLDNSLVEWSPDTGADSFISSTIPQVPLIWPVDYFEDPTISTAQPKDLNPRILYFGGQRGGIDGTIWFNDNSISFPLPQNIFQDDHIALFAVNSNDTTGLDPVLSYDDQEISGIGVQGLASRYFIRTMARIRVGKQREQFVYWNNLDILNLDFRSKRLIGSERYILQEINSFNLLTDASTKTTLMFDAVDEQADFDALTKSNISSILGGNIELSPS